MLWLWSQYDWEDGAKSFHNLVSVPNFSEDQRNWNSRYEIQGVVSESFSLTAPVLCFLNIVRSEFHLLSPFCWSVQGKFQDQDEKRPMLKSYVTECMAFPIPEPHLSVHWNGVTGSESPDISSWFRVSSAKKHPVYPRVCDSPQSGTWQRDMVSPFGSQPAWFVPNPTPDLYFGSLTGLN